MHRLTAFSAETSKLAIRKTAGLQFSGAKSVFRSRLSAEGKYMTGYIGAAEYGRTFSSKASDGSPSGSTKSGTLGEATRVIKSLSEPNLKNIICVPVPVRPVFPGSTFTFSVTNAQEIAALKSCYRSNSPYISLFLAKGSQTKPENTGQHPEQHGWQPETASGMPEDATVDWNNVEDQSALYDVGTLASIVEIQRRSSKFLGGHGAFPAIPTGDLFGTRLQEMRGGITVKVKAMERVKLNKVKSLGPPVLVQVSKVQDQLPSEKLHMVSAYNRLLKQTLNDVVSQGQWSRELWQFVKSFEGGRLADYLCAQLDGGEELQSLLAETDVVKRMEETLFHMRRELRFHKAQADIQEEMNNRLNKQDKDPQYFPGRMDMPGGNKKPKTPSSDPVALYESRFKTFRQLTEEEIIAQGGVVNAEEALLARIRDNGAVLPPHAADIIQAELEKLKSADAASSSSEVGIIKGYLDVLTSYPWGIRTKDNLDLHHAEKVLNEDHYGMEKVKKRILEHIAVSALSGDKSGKIICFSGPPGTGKTSVGQSIARALGRKFHRISVGGAYDVSEIKGHRRTYIGAMPGKVVQTMRNTGVSNPVILIDEIDKVSTANHHGDVSACLLELLDPNQNTSFHDYYMDLGVDMSQVLFICTCNDESRIPAPLQDRMEMIELPGYDPLEKREIASQYLIPKAKRISGFVDEQDSKDATVAVTPEPDSNEETKANSTDDEDALQVPRVPREFAAQVKIHPDAISKLIDSYAPEPGMRSLNKFIEQIFRKLAYRYVQLSEEERNDPSVIEEKFHVKADDLVELLGSHYLSPFEAYRGIDTPGIVCGLAVTGSGGHVLVCETTATRRTGPAAGKSNEGGEEGEGLNTSAHSSGGFFATGMMEPMMQESTQIAYINARKMLQRLEPENRFFEEHQVHLHFPTGSRKDGNSAGIAMALALLSLALDKPIPWTLAMTGEITLSGRATAIGGVASKILGAHRHGCNTVLLPNGNKPDFDELQDHQKELVDVRFVGSFDEVVEIAFGIRVPPEDHTHSRSTNLQPPSAAASAA